MAGLLSFVLRLEAVAARLSTWFAYGAAVMAALLVSLLVASTVKRYLFASPIPETEELASLLFLAIVMLAIPYGFCASRHVRLDLAWRRFAEPKRTYLEAIGLLFGAAVVSVIVHYTLRAALFNYSINARSDMNELLLWPWGMLLPLCLGLLAVNLFVRSAVLVLSAATGTVAKPMAGLKFGTGLHE